MANVVWGGRGGSAMSVSTVGVAIDAHGLPMVAGMGEVEEAPACLVTGIGRIGFDPTLLRCDWSVAEFVHSI